MILRHGDTVTRGISGAFYLRVSASPFPRVLQSLPLLFLAAILTLMPLERIWAGKALSELAATDPDGDWDHDGLPNSEEAEYSTNPIVNDTDGDTALDGKDGWAGGTDRWFEALLAPPRIPKVHYALMDIGTGWAWDLKVNSKGQVFGDRSEGQCFWDEDDIIPLPSQQSGRLIYFSDMNNKGEFIGVMDVVNSEEQLRVVRWNQNDGLSTIDTSPIVGTDTFGPSNLGMPSLNDYGVAVGQKEEIGQFSSGEDYWQYDAMTFLRLEGSSLTQVATHIYRSMSADAEQYPVGWTTNGRVIRPAFIKNSGWIAGTYRDIEEGGNFEVWPTGIVSIDANGTQHAIPGPEGVFSLTEQGYMIGSEDTETLMWIHKYGQYHKRHAIYGSLNSRLELAEVANGSIWRNFKSFYVKGLVNDDDYDFIYPLDVAENGVMVAAGLNVSDSEYHSFLLVPIEMTWKALDGFENVEDNKRVTAVDAFDNPTTRKWMDGHGSRIFPDKKNPTDDTQFRNRCVLHIKAGLANRTVYLKSFDVDDATPDSVDNDPENKLDSNGKAGDDNKDTLLPKAGKFVSSTSNTTTVTLDENGEANVIFETTKQPGDNFRVAAAFTEEDLNSDTLQVSDPDGNGFIEGDSAKQPKGFNGVVSPMLTVWRRLWLEFDSMGSPPNSLSELQPGWEPNHDEGLVIAVQGNTPTTGETTLRLHVNNAASSSGELTQAASAWENGRIDIEELSHTVISAENFSGYSEVIVGATLGSAIVGKDFKIYDDDKVQIGLRPPRTLPYQLSGGGLIYSAYSDAFIEPAKVPSEYIQTNVPFKRNLNIFNYYLDWMPTVTSNRDLEDADDFWVVYLLCSWQPEAGSDRDPDTDAPRMGQSDPGTINVDERNFGTVHIETIREIGTVPTMPKTEEQHTVVHEIGHQGKGEHTDGGIMADGAPSTEDKFRPITIKRFRENRDF